MYPVPQDILSATESSSSSSRFKSRVARADHWKGPETMQLIELLERYKVAFASVKRNNHIWEEISHNMKLCGFSRTPSQCRNRKKVLFRLHKECTMDAHKQRRNEYYQSIQRIIEDDLTGPSETPTLAPSTNSCNKISIQNLIDFARREEFSNGVEFENMGTKDMQAGDQINDEIDVNTDAKELLETTFYSLNKFLSTNQSTAASYNSNQGISPVQTPDSWDDASSSVLEYLKERDDYLQKRHENERKVEAQIEEDMYRVIAQKLDTICQYFGKIETLHTV